jgi:serine phosphatase RsbU (regulator of sigma subunit)
MKTTVSKIVCLVSFLVLLICFNVKISAQSSRCENYLNKAEDVYSSNPDSSFYYANLGLECALSKQDTILLAEAYSQFGRYYLLKSNLKLSENNLNKAQQFYIYLNNKAGLAHIYSLKSILQKRIHNYKESIRFIELSVELYQQLPKKNGLISGLLNLSNSYIGEKDTAKLKYTFLRLDTLYPIMSLHSRYYYLQNKARFLMLEKKYQKADSLLEQAFDIATKENMIDSRATITMVMGRNYRLMNKLKESEKILKQSEIICKESNLDHELVETYTELVETYKLMENYKLSLFYFETLSEIEKKIINLEKVNEIASLEKKLVETEKQKEIEGEKEKTNIEVGKNKKLIITLFLISALLFLSIYLYVRTQKLKNKIHEKSMLVQQKATELAARQKEILDSINYAKKIQYALLANKSFIDANLKSNFVFFKPKDIVSGDFYWATSRASAAGDLFYLAVCDSTGHGVPGAFMSLLSIGFLSEAINEKQIEKPNEVFNYVRSRLVNSVTGEGQKDGFDGILVCFNKTTGEITYASAYNKPILIEDGKIIELPTDKMPVGLGVRETSFTNFTITHKSNAKLYLYTDGYADQFGGEKGKKFKYKQLNDFILSNSDEQMQTQANKLAQNLTAWQGDLEQVDDICVIGINL